MTEPIVANENHEEPSRLPKVFRALQHRNYRLLWIGNLISQSGDWMDQVAFSWLIYSMTNSTVWLAMINVCRAGPIIFFTLLGGVVADRVERRRLLFTTQFVLMVLAFMLAGLYTGGILQVWMAFAIAVGRGITASFNQPARQSLISELVPAKDLPNAIALNSATMNLTKIIGPASGGILIAAIGVDGAFYANGASYIAVLTSLYFMDLPPRVTSPHEEGILTDLKEGFLYMRREKALLTLIFLALMPMVFGQPYQTMLTVFAKDVQLFNVGSTGLGVMQSITAVGSVSGAIIMASSGESHWFVHKMLLGLIGFGGAILLFSFAPSFWLALPALLIAGLCLQTYQTSNNTLLQLKVNPEYRARVLSMLFLQRGLVPLGTMLVGALAPVVGPRFALGGMALILLLLSGITYPIALPILTRLMPHEENEGKELEEHVADKNNAELSLIVHEEKRDEENQHTEKINGTSGAEAEAKSSPLLPVNANTPVAVEVVMSPAPLPHAAPSAEKPLSDGRESPTFAPRGDAAESSSRSSEVQQQTEEKKERLSVGMPRAIL